MHNPGVVRPPDTWARAQKEIFDRTVALILLIVLAPLLLLIVIAIRFNSPGPLLFCQPRAGLNNRVFVIFKFRTMFHDCADLLCDTQTTRDDRRVTAVGRVLRKYSLDELPQLLNVVIGDMSLVGPRPHALNTRADGDLLESVVSHYAARHVVKPGITGWAQVNGARGELRTGDDLEKRVRYDIEYINNWSMLFDIRVIALTFAKEIFSSRAY